MCLSFLIIKLLHPLLDGRHLSSINLAQRGVCVRVELQLVAAVCSSWNDTHGVGCSRRQLTTRTSGRHNRRGPPWIELSSSPLQAVRVDVEPAASDSIDVGHSGALGNAVGVVTFLGEEEAALTLKVGLRDEARDEVALAADLPPLEAVTVVSMRCPSVGYKQSF